MSQWDVEIFCEETKEVLYAGVEHIFHHLVCLGMMLSVPRHDFLVEDCRNTVKNSHIHITSYRDLCIKIIAI